MSTLAEHPPEITMAADDFQALEERVLRTVELLKGERELRYSVEQHAARLTHRVEEQAAQHRELGHPEDAYCHANCQRREAAVRGDAHGAARRRFARAALARPAGGGRGFDERR